MKKLFTLALGGLLAGTAAAENVYTPVEYNAYELSLEQFNSLNLDGKADEAFWAGAKSEPCAVVSANPGEDPVNPNGYAATWKALYDEYNLYLHVDVTDATPVWYTSDVNFTEADNVELFFSQAPREPLDSEVRDPNGSQLRLHPGYSVANFVSGGRFAAGNITDGILSGCEYATAVTDKGYSIEAIIPWDGVISSDLLDIKAGSKVLFDINPANVVAPKSEGGGTRVCILSWSTCDFNAWKYNRQLGTLNLMGAGAGVDDMIFDNSDAPAEYYTIDGKHVAAPASGLYIVRRGNEVSKAFIR